MKRNILSFLCWILIMLIPMTGCTGNDSERNTNTDSTYSNLYTTETIMPTAKMLELEKDFYTVKFTGDDGFSDFLENGGASSDKDVVSFLSSRLATQLDIGGNPFGCSTLAVESPDGKRLFGRNFDWQSCEALILLSEPSDGYASVSTVNMDFITQSGVPESFLSQDSIRTFAALYAPLDGMNEAGFAISVNMISDSATIRQNTDKPDITTTTAVRLLLNKAETVAQALELLESYDMHASMDYMVHFAMTDRTGRSVVVEYVENEMVVTDTPVVTNFYIAEGEKHGIGTQQSHERYDILTKALANTPSMTMLEATWALDSVSKDNFGEFESTEWSAVFNLNTGEANYYHRENYNKCYHFKLR